MSDTPSEYPKYDANDDPLLQAINDQEATKEERKASMLALLRQAATEKRPENIVLQLADLDPSGELLVTPEVIEAVKELMSSLGNTDLTDLTYYSSLMSISTGLLTLSKKSKEIQDIPEIRKMGELSIRHSIEHQSNTHEQEVDNTIKLFGISKEYLLTPEIKELKVIAEFGKFGAELALKLADELQLSHEQLGQALRKAQAKYRSPKYDPKKGW